MDYNLIEESILNLPGMDKTQKPWIIFSCGVAPKGWSDIRFMSMFGVSDKQNASVLAAVLSATHCQFDQISEDYIQVRNKDLNRLFGLVSP